MPFWPLDPDPGSGIGFFPNPGSPIPDPKPIFLRVYDKFVGKSSIILWKLTQIFLFSTSVKFVATKKGMITNFLSSGIRDPGSEIRDPRSGIRDPGWVKIRIQDKRPGSATLERLLGFLRLILCDLALQTGQSCPRRISSPPQSAHTQTCPQFNRITWTERTPFEGTVRTD